MIFLNFQVVNYRINIRLATACIKYCLRLPTTLKWIMQFLIKNNTLLTTQAAIIFLVSACNANMTYEEFIVRFQQQCSDYYLVKDLAPQAKVAACDCLLKTTQQNYSDMQSLLAGIRALDREPRGETDYVPSAIRMAAATCIKK